MLDVFFSVDTEIWCDGWHDLDSKFPTYFKSYVYGPTAKGDYGLPYVLRQLEEFGLVGVFFVEPLFSLRFGNEPLKEIIGLLTDAGQEVQLHMHTEWVDEAKVPLFPDLIEKRQHLRYFSLAEQKQLIGTGLKLLDIAGVSIVNAFRAGSFGFNINTLKALASKGVAFDSSYNATLMGFDSGLMPQTLLCEPYQYQGVYEYPITVYKDGSGGLRHTQLGACSFRELEGLLWKALEGERKSFMILSHNFELLNQRMDRADPIMVERMKKLFQFFDRNRDCFRLRGFNDLEAKTTISPAPLTSPIWKTGMRVAEQLYRRKYF